jgi:anti-anti-sigma factor
MDDMSGPLVFDERLVDGVVILSVSKGLKGPGEEALKQRLDGLVGQGFLRILVDLREVPYLDSTDLGRLIRCHAAVRRAGGRVRLFNASEKVRALMKMTRLDTVMELYDGEADALASLRPDESVADSVS